MKIKISNLFLLISEVYSDLSNSAPYHDVYHKLLHGYQGVSRNPIVMTGNFIDEDNLHPYQNEEIDYAGILVFYENYETKQWTIQEFKDRRTVELFIMDSVYNLCINHPCTTIIEDNAVVDYDIYYPHLYEEVVDGELVSEILKIHELHRDGDYFATTHETAASTFDRDELIFDWECDYDNY